MHSNRSCQPNLSIGLVCAFALFTSILFAPFPLASAAYPGRNGKIAFTSSTEPSGVYTVNPDGTGLRHVAETLGNDVAWAPRGHALAYVGYAGYLDHQTVWGIYVTRPDGTGNRLLTPVSMQTATRKDARTPTWSPDGQRLAFTWGVHKKDGWHTKLAIINRDGTGMHMVPNTLDAVSPTWSPEGSDIAFIGVEHGQTGIYSIRYDGTGLRLLAPGRWRGSASCRSLDWSPDARGLVFAAAFSPERKTEIYVLKVTSGTYTPITRTPYVEELCPSWSPDGRKIAYSSDATGFYDIWMMNRDGSARTRVTRLYGYDTSPSWQPVVSS